MTRLRAAKVAGIARDIPPTELDDQEGAEVLVIGWGSTYGAIAAGVERVRARGHKAAQAHLVHLNPVPLRPRRRRSAATDGCSSPRSTWVS